MIIKKLIPLVLLIMLVQVCKAQISGPTTVTVGEAAVYTFSNGVVYTSYTWGTGGGAIVVSPSRNGTVYSVTLQWSASGTPTIAFLDSNYHPVGTLSITVVGPSCTPANPTGTISVSGTCDFKTLSYNQTSVPSGTSWYWQTSSSGMSTSNPYYTNSVSVAGTYYVRAKSSTKNCWSSGTISINVPQIPTSPPAPPVPTVKVNSSCGAKILTHTANTSYFWQGTTLGGVDATSAIAMNQDFTAAVDGTNTYYLGATNGTCWSYSNISLSVNNPPAPNPNTLSFCEWETMNLTTTGYATSLNWYNATTNSLLVSSPTYTPTNLDVGTYTYSVKNLKNTCESSSATTVTLVVKTCDDQVNWRESVAYGIDPVTGTEKPVSDAKVYYDGFGSVVQSQSLSFATNQIFASQNIYDFRGNQVLTTLPAPINSSTFVYKDRFVTKNVGGAINQKYSASDFDTDASNPTFVSSNGPGSLGWYYSTANNLEPNTPVTNFPYARSWTEPGPDPKNSESGLPGDLYKMGAGHTTKGQRQTFAKSELSHYFSIRQHFVTSPLPVSQNDVNLISNADGNSVTGYSGSRTTVSVVNQNNDNYIKVTATQSVDMPGVIPIGGNISVTPGATYTFKVKGYSVTSLPTYILVSPVGGSYNLVWPGNSLPRNASNEGWAENTFTIPVGCTSINVGVVCNGTVSGDLFYINSVSLTQVINTESMLYGYKYISTDADGKKVVSFADGDGHELASAIVTNSSPMTYDYWTYNFFNDMGQLVATVAPKGVVIGDFSYPNFVTTYGYDHLGRLIEVNSPDEGKSQFVYSTDGRIRFSQNAQQRYTDAQKLYQSFSYTNYDFFGRPIESGEYTVRNSNPFVFETDMVDPAQYQANSVMKIIDLDLPLGQDIESMSGYGGISGKTDTTRCSDYTFIKYDKQGKHFPDSAITTQKNLRYQVSKTENKNAATWYSYDEFGRVVKTWQKINKLSAVKTVDYTYDSNGNMITLAYQQNDSNEKYFHFYTYDADQRLYQVYSNATGNPVTSGDLRATYKYYLHGPLKRLELGNIVQGIDYVYNIDGSLKAINHADNAKDPGNDGNDIFGETLQYNASDYQGAKYTTGVQNGLTSYPASYSGLPQSISWHSAMDNQQMNSYAYQYDNLNQLVSSTYGSSTSTTSGNYQFTSSSAFFEAVPTGYDANNNPVSGYDKNGNIRNLLRFGKNGNSIGSFSYHYSSANNRLNSVTDSNLPLTVNYTYNNIGQVTQQSESGGKSMIISYNAKGLVQDIKNASGQYLQRYFYDDRGDLIVKIDYNAGVEKLDTYYVRDIRGNVLAIYTRKNATGSAALSEFPVYGASRLGEFRPKDGASGTYYYEVNDHLGDVRGVIAVPVSQPPPCFANFETATNSAFGNYTNRSDFDLVDHTDKDGKVYTYSQHLTGADGLQIGLTRSLQVSPGDKVKIEVYAKYMNDTGGNQSSMSSLPQAILSAFGSSPGWNTDPSGGFSAISSFGNLMAAGTARAHTSSYPKAFATMLLFDNNFNLVDASWRQIADSSYQANDGVKTAHEYIHWEITISQPGYAFIFLSNENPTQVDVYFDDFTITHTESPIVAGADYYPYGMVMEGREIIDSKYRWGYQGQFAEKDSTSGWNEFKLRMYDARFGRWLSPDPYGQFSSPYLGMGNGPHIGVDPNGGFWGMGLVASGAVIGAAAGTAVGLIADPDHWYYYTAGGAALGGLAGGIYNSSTYDIPGLGREGRNPGGSSGFLNAGTGAGQLLASTETQILNFEKTTVTKKTVNNIDVIYVSKDERLNHFRETTMYGSGGEYSGYIFDVYIEFDKNFDIKAIGGYGKYVNRQYGSEPVTTPVKLVISEKMQEMIDIVQRYHKGGFIGDNRSVIKKYFDYIEEVDPDHEDMFGNPIHKKNRLNAVSSPHR